MHSLPLARLLLGILTIVPAQAGDRSSSDEFKHFMRSTEIGPGTQQLMVRMSCKGTKVTCSVKNVTGKPIEMISWDDPSHLPSAVSVLFLRRDGSIIPQKGGPDPGLGFGFVLKPGESRKGQFDISEWLPLDQVRSGEEVLVVWCTSFGRASPDWSKKPVDIASGVFAFKNHARHK